MSKQTQALKLALEYATEALNYHDSCYNRHPATEAERNIIVEDLNTIREALEQPEVWVTPKLRPLAKLAKELDGVVADVEQGDGFDDVCLDTVKYVRDELTTQPAQHEPVIDKSAAIRIATALGWAPRKPWVGLTSKEIYECEPKADWYDVVDFGRAIEAKLREKNA